MEKIRLKFSFVKEKLKGKRIILIDDSIVRGSTLRGLVSVLKDWCEVAEVHVRIGCPPIVAPCFYGIDFPTIEELYAGKDAPNAEDFNADSLKYISMNGLLNSISKDSRELCTSCISNVYPTSVGRERYEKVKA
jgi:amidophosphoribosyltransferase